MAEGGGASSARSLGTPVRPCCPAACGRERARQRRRVSSHARAGRGVVTCPLLPPARAQPPASYAPSLHALAAQSAVAGRAPLVTCECGVGWACWSSAAHGPARTHGTSETMAALTCCRRHARCLAEVRVARSRGLVPAPAHGWPLMMIWATNSAPSDEYCTARVHARHVRMRRMCVPPACVGRRYTRFAARPGCASPRAGWLAPGGCEPLVDRTGLTLRTGRAPVEWCWRVACKSAGSALRRYAANSRPRTASPSLGRGVLRARHWRQSSVEWFQAKETPPARQISSRSGLRLGLASSKMRRGI